MRAARWILLLLCGAGLLRDISVHAWKEHPLRARRERRRPDTAYLWIPPLLPRDVDKVAFATDEPAASEEGSRRLYDARYGLCPRVVALGLDTKYVVGEVGQPANLEMLSRALGFPVVAARGTIALLERRP